MNLPRYQNCVLDHRYHLGSFRDYSGNNNHGTPHANCYWRHSGESKEIMFPSNGTDIIVADSPELQLTTGTIIVYNENGFDDYSYSGRMVSKRDAGGTNYEFYMGTVDTVRFNGGTWTVATVNQKGATSLAVSFTSGVKPKFYKHGAFITDGSATVAVTANNAPLAIGGLSYTSSYFLKDELKGVLIYNIRLTAQEIAQVHEWIMLQKTPTYPKKNFIYPTKIEKESNFLAGWTMKDYGGKIYDISDDNYIGTAGAVIPRNDFILQGIPGIRFSNAVKNYDPKCEMS